MRFWLADRLRPGKADADDAENYSAVVGWEGESAYRLKHKSQLDRPGDMGRMREISDPHAAQRIMKKLKRR